MTNHQAPPGTADEMTAAEALQQAQERLAGASIDDGRIEAEVLLMHALGTGRERLYARLREPLPAHTQQAFEEMLARRAAHEPSAYITGHREFYGLDLACTRDALIPRPETELLVDLAMEHLAGKHSPALVIDVGTGNGAIAVAIAAHAPGARVMGIDPSREALELARRNAEAHGVAERVSFVQGSLLGPLRARADVVVANLPYISTGEYAALAPEIREHEPEAALHWGERGTELIEELLGQAPGRLARGGLLVAEHAWDQGEALREAAGASFPEARIDTARDLSGHERAVVVWGETSAA